LLIFSIALMKNSKNKTGFVYLIGAGPGDAGLLTLKGRDSLIKSDVIVYDHLVNKALLRYALDSCELIYAGKIAGTASLQQEEINALLIEKAGEGKIVSRLKGGDPFIFGRGGEEAQALNRVGIPFVVIPGVSSFTGVSAYAGIPLTHRHLSSSFSVITGSAEKSQEDETIDWKNIAKRSGTLVFLMGARRLPHIVAKLIEYGKDPETPVAVIRKGTTGEQKTCIGTLATISEIARQENISPPALTVIGEVVNLKKEIDWYEKLPLFGKTIVVTRPEKQSESFIRALEEMGAEPLAMPVIKTVPPDDWGPLDKALQSLGSYYGLIFTSVNGVDFFMQRLKETDCDLCDLKGVRIYAIGPKTEQAVRNLGLRVNASPKEFIAEALLECLQEEPIAGKRFLLPRAKIAREILPQEIIKLGAEIDVVPAYQTIAPVSIMREEFMRKLHDGEIDAITFTSSSTVINFLELIEGADLEKLKSVAVACIGPITADTAREKGLNVVIMPQDYTAIALADAIESYFIAQKKTFDS
jgi:uroporphyrinogen III methyltransferase / synthase